MVISLLFVGMACLVVPARGQDTSPLVLVQTIELPRVEGGLNHMSVDTEHQRLFVPAPSDKRLEIVDLASGQPWRSLESERPAAARYSPEFNQLYVSSGRYVYIYDGNKFTILARVDLHSRLDEIAYDVQAKRLYVGCMTAGETGVAVIALPQGKLLERIPLSASPQGIAVEEGGARVFANLPDTSHVEVVSQGERRNVAKWSLKGASDNFPMALDGSDHRLFVACRAPAQLVVLDTGSGEVIARVPCVRDADDMWYDAVRHRIYISGDGLVSIIQQQEADRYRLLGSVGTAPGAATSVFSGQLNSLYVGVPRRDAAAAQVRVFKISR
jgi:DNA-binding beta-propeller fold protein YncE